MGRIQFAPQVSGSGECSSVLAVPGEEEVRIPGFPRNESAVKLPNPKGSASVSSRRRLTNPKS